VGESALLPTPKASDATRGAGPSEYRRKTPILLAVARRIADGNHGSSPLDWREFEPAVRRWERLSGLAAPFPTTEGKRGARVLNPALPEWMMGLPPGHVTGVPDVTRTEMIALLGNGVFPLQAETAIRALVRVLA
jgi:DNA (cytosine-5)-methyltransferase 1